MGTLVALQPLCKDTDPECLDEASKEKARAVCNASLALIEQYMNLHAQAILDRGCEGNLVSYYDTAWKFTAKLRAMFGGEPVAAADQSNSDDPPSPAI